MNNFPATTPISEKILILTVHTNDADFLELQHDLLLQNCKVPFDFVVGFDNPEKEIFALGKDDIRNSFVATTRSRGIPLVEIPRWAHTEREKLFPNSDFKKYSHLDPALRCADSVQYMLGVLPWQRYKAILFLDADMFLIQPLRDVPVSASVPFSGVKQIRTRGKREVIYIWNGIFWISGDVTFSYQINFDLIKDKGLRTDVGGKTSNWIQRQAEAGTPGNFMNYFWSSSWGEAEAQTNDLSQALVNWLETDYRNEKPGRYFAELYAGIFLHYRGGGNWQQRNPKVDLVNRKNFVKAVLGN